MRVGAKRCGIVVMLAIGMFGPTATGAVPQLQPVLTERIADVTLRVLVEGGKLLIGPNDIVLEFRSSSGQSDMRGATLVATRPDSAAGSISVELSPDGAGRFHGTLNLPWTKNCRLEVRWRDNQGGHSHIFTVPVIVGHH
jgi:hypothetical protein